MARAGFPLYRPVFVRSPALQAVLGKSVGPRLAPRHPESFHPPRLLPYLSPPAFRFLCPTSTFAPLRAPCAFAVITRTPVPHHSPLPPRFAPLQENRPHRSHPSSSAYILSICGSVPFPRLRVSLPHPAPISRLARPAAPFTFHPHDRGASSGEPRFSDARGIHPPNLKPGHAAVGSRETEHPFPLPRRASPARLFYCPDTKPQIPIHLPILSIRAI